MAEALCSAGLSGAVYAGERLLKLGVRAALNDGPHNMCSAASSPTTAAGERGKAA